MAIALIPTSVRAGQQVGFGENFLGGGDIPRARALLKVSMSETICILYSKGLRVDLAETFSGGFAVAARYYIEFRSPQNQAPVTSKSQLQ